MVVSFDSRPPRLTLGWVFGRPNHLSISPSHTDQLSLLPSAGHEMSTGQSAVMLWLIPLVDKRVGGG